MFSAPVGSYLNPNILFFYFLCNEDGGEGMWIGKTSALSLTEPVMNKTQTDICFAETFLGRYMWVSVGEQRPKMKKEKKNNNNLLQCFQMFLVLPQF